MAIRWWPLFELNCCPQQQSSSSQHPKTWSLKTLGLRYTWCWSVVHPDLLTHLSCELFVHSFIHSYRYLYSTPSRLLLRSAPNSNVPKEDSLQIRIERLRMNPNDAKESPFQTERPTVEKSRFCLVEIWANEQKACSAPHSSNCGWGGGYEARRQVLGLMWEGTVGKISSKGN